MPKETLRVEARMRVKAGELVLYSENVQNADSRFQAWIRRRGGQKLGDPEERTSVTVENDGCCNSNPY